MKRPILWVLVFFIWGIIIGAYADMPFFGMSIIVGIFLCFILYHKFQYYPVFVFSIFLILGAWRIGHSLNNHVTYSQYNVQLSGVVQDIGVTSGGNQRVIIRTNNGIRFMIYIRPYLPWAQLGQDIVVTGDLHPLARQQNPGGYNQFQHLRSQKVDATIWADTIQLGEVRLSITVVLRILRDRISAVYNELLPPREAAVIRAMVLGDRYDMDRNLADQYRRMGIFHILSISGLHVAILMMAFNAILGLFVNERKSSIIVLVVMVLYCLMSGASPATVRAVTMGGILVFGKVLHRGYDLLAAVSWVGVVLLMYEPLFLFNVGFQLSFVAVYGIAVLTHPVERMLAKVRFPQLGKFRSGLAVNIAAVSSTYPVFAFHFYEIPLYSVIGNIIVAPTTTIILVTGVAIGILGLVWTVGATFISGTVYYILRFYEVSSFFFSNLPLAMLLTGGGNLVVSGLWATVLLTFAYAFNGYGETFKQRLRLLPIIVATLIIVLFLRHNPRGMHITTLDTWGNYTVIRHRGDVLVIGAPRGGEDTLLRYLDMHGIAIANGLIMTELPRTQDVNRLIRLAERFDVFYISGNTTEVMSSLTIDALNNVAQANATMPEIVFLYCGSLRAVGHKTTQVFTDAAGSMSVNINFGAHIISIEEKDRIANVQIIGYSIKTANETFTTRGHGSISIHVNRRRIRFR